MAEESEGLMEVRVRSLNGDSTSIWAAADSTVSELKARLKESFPPVNAFTNFHLFFKGAKMKMEKRLGSYAMTREDFVVLVPFSKKNQQTNNLEHSVQGMVLSSHSDHGTASSFACSAWDQMRRDLSLLTNILSDETKPVETFSNENDNDNNHNVGDSKRPVKRRRFSSCLHQGICDLVHNLLHSGSVVVLNKQTCGKIHQTFEAATCLYDYEKGNCLLSEELSKFSLGHAEPVPGNLKSKECICPTWLKKLLKTFTLLNILSGFLQIGGKDVNRNHLEEAIKQFNEISSEDISFMEIEQLSVLCPKVVMFGNQGLKSTKLGEVIVVVDSSPQNRSESFNCETDKFAFPNVRRSATAMVKAIEKRDNTFRTDLRIAIMCFMGEKQIGKRKSSFFSLDELLLFMRGHVISRTEEKLKNKRMSLASSGHFSYERCKETMPLQPLEIVDHLKRGIGVDGQIVHVENIGAKEAVYGELPKNLSETTMNALKQIGISRLYSHQAESVKASLLGKNVVLATSTSSGKSLCYNLPVLEVLTKNLSSCALYIFPTKALAQDQFRSLLVMTGGLGMDLNIGVYDGDTCQEHRCWLRDNARLLITNPDMLHLTILPNHKQFERILSNLRFIIIDEAHAYKGAFGCHIALILRRLRRICSHVYGTEPSFILSTATSANPQEHALELANLRNLELIQEDGSPCGEKIFLLWNPPFCLKNKPNSSTRKSGIISEDTELDGRRMSSIAEASSLFAEMVQHGLRCIAFCKTRKLSELVLFYTHEILKETAPNLVDAVCAYRAGYTAMDRRRIESDLFGGRIRGVAATNALELGIDVGHLDVTLHLGFPGSIASLWQQAGRSGRREKPSLSVYVAFGSPLDQYFMKFPQKLFCRPMECCQVNSHNVQVIEQHLLCAAFELPLCLQYDEIFFGSGVDNAIMHLKNKGCLGSHPSHVSSAQIWSYIGHEKYPSHTISIRTIENEKYKVIDMTRNEVLEEIDESKAFFQVYEGAVYMHQGKTYLVKVLNLSEKTALCQEADLKYYTKTRDYTDIHVVGGDLAYPVKISENQRLRTTAQASSCQVTTTWFGFYRIWRGSKAIFDTVDLSLPTYSFNSQAVWIRIPHDIKTALESKLLSFRAGRHAACHALLNVVPLYTMCNSSDLGSECANPHDTRYIPERLLLYDQHPGGIGLSAQVQLMFGELLVAALELVTMCNCSSDYGCPNCIQTLSCREYNELLDKDAAVMILKAVIEAENF